MRYYKYLTHAFILLHNCYIVRKVSAQTAVFAVIVHISQPSNLLHGSEKA